MKIEVLKGQNGQMTVKLVDSEGETIKNWQGMHLSFSQVIRTPGDMVSFVSWVDKKMGAYFEELRRVEKLQDLAEEAIREIETKYLGE